MNMDMKKAPMPSGFGFFKSTHRSPVAKSSARQRARQVIARLSRGLPPTCEKKTKMKRMPLSTACQL